MYIRKLSAATFLLLCLATFGYGQTSGDTKQLIESIQSIAKSKRLKKGTVNYLSPSNFNNTMDMDAKALTRIREFRFEGQFLVIDESYFNLDKLLYFTPRKDYIDFVFQVY